MRTSFCLAAMMLVAVSSSSLAPASAADLFRHRHYRSAGSDIYPDDYGCRQQEPSVYRPRTLNYSEPLCYAARPYGISTHLYDHPRELGDYNSAAGY